MGDEKLDTRGLKEFAQSLGFQSVGVCSADPPPHVDAYRAWIGKGFHGEMAYLAEHIPLKEHSENLLPEVKSIIACALNYYQPLDVQPGRAKIARYALGRDYHRVLRSKLRKLGVWIEGQHPHSSTRACVDSAPIMERDYAAQAGLGFFGKNTMLIDPKRGSWFFIGLLLTTVPFQIDAQSVGGCGSCTKCIDACPTGAIVHEDDRWQLDARQCISYLTIEKRGPIDGLLRRQIGDWTFGCDICQEVCPFNEQRVRQPLRSNVADESDFLRERDRPPLDEMANLGYERWDEMTQGSALRRAGWEGLRRNAIINLENASISESDSESL